MLTYNAPRGQCTRSVVRRARRGGKLPYLRTPAVHLPPLLELLAVVRLTFLTLYITECSILQVFVVMKLTVCKQFKQIYVNVNLL